MTKSKHDKRAPARSAEARMPIAPGAASRLESALFVFLIALIPLRTFLNESNTFEVPRLFRGLDAPAGAGPAATFVISALILLAGALVAFTRLRSDRGWLPTGAGIGALTLLVAGAVSTWFAGQKHFALIGVIDFLAMFVYFMTLRQLMTRPWQVRVALFVVVSTGAVVVAKCALQRWVEWPMTIEYFEEHRAELTKGDYEAGSNRRSGMEHDYEMRLRSGAVTAYYAHPNLLASQIILFAIAAISLAVERRRSGAPIYSIGVPMAISIGLLAALIGTQSKGAVAAFGIALLIWCVCSLLGRRFPRHTRPLLAGGWLLALAAFIAVVIALNAKPDLLGRSILFRHMYWQGAVAMVKDHPLAGVGANNFGRHFTRYKSVECPEEVDSPHSWPVQFLTEWGPLGLIGFLLAAIGVSRRLAGPAGSRPIYDDSIDDDASPVLRSTVFWTTAVGVIVLGWWLIDIQNSGVDFLILHLGFAAIAWFVCAMMVSIERWPDPRISDAPLPNLVPVLAAGLIAFLIHTSIDLALFSSGPATTFFALAAITLAARSLQARSTDDGDVEGSASAFGLQTRLNGFALPILFGGAATAIAILVFLVRPCTILGNAFRVARSETRPSPWNAYTSMPAYEAYERGHHAYDLDATAATELSEQLIPRVRNVSNSDTVLHLLEEAHRRDPDNALIVGHQSGTYRQRYEITHDRADFESAIVLYRTCIADYPTSPDRHINLANLLEEYAATFERPEFLREALTQLKTALELEKQRVYVSQPNRMRPEDIAAIQQRIDHLIHALTE